MPDLVTPKPVIDRLHNEIRGVKIALGEKLRDHPIGIRMLDLKKRADRLHFSRRRLMLVKRVNGDRRPVIRKLGQVERAFVRANDETNRRLIEMEKRVNILAPGPDRLHITDLKQLAKLEPHVAELEHAAYLFPGLEFVPAVNARTKQNLKCAAKTMLMNRRRAVQPDICVDIKTGCDKDRYWRIAKAAGGVLLPRQLILFERPLDDLSNRNL